MPIHPTAIVDKTSEIDSTAEIGAYAIVEGGVRIGADTRIYPHGYIGAGTTLGRGCEVHPFAVVGHLPQDLKFEGAPTYTEVGDETVVREHATIHRGTMPGSKTVVGRRCFIMSTGHIGHNCVLGDEVIVVNSGLLAGHVEVGARAFVSGNGSVHQFVRIGEMAMIGGGTVVLRDLPPFMTALDGVITGLNTVGLRRAGFTSAERRELQECHRVLYRRGLHFPPAIERVAAMVETEPGRRLLAFLRGPSKRGFMRSRRRGRATVDADE